ncbi:MAG TPA: cyclic nucleotide-binding domain-containing protein [Myxococcales bacterium]|nr:cyclic nucleotide-binding domain-containing protein [Myxococcales bacterium]
MDLDLSEMAKVSKLFESLDNAGRVKLLKLSHRRQKKAGEVIFREGDPGGEFYVLAKGEVRVAAESLEGEKELARLGHGQFFGEMAALNGDRRTATCTAATDVDLIVFPADAVERVLAEYPAARETLHRVGILRSEDTLQKMME